MINISEVIETNKMIEQENFDVRTITMGINLLDCATSDLDQLCQNIYNKITRLAKDLVKTGEDISKEYGVPIVNKRISITPIALVGGSACKTTDDYVKIAKTLDKCAKEEENLANKTALCEKIEAINLKEKKQASDWEDATKAIIEIQGEWKKIGFAPQKMNVKIFERFRIANDEFFSKKAEFFKNIKSQYAENLEKKQKLVEKAKQLADSTEWKKTGDKLIQMQREWKNIGYVPRKQGDQLWKEFLGACNKFFDARNKLNAGARSEEHANLDKKREIIAKLNELVENAGEHLQKNMQDLIAEYNAVGHVPFKEKDKVYQEYHEVMDKLYKTVRSNNAKRHIHNFKNNLKNVAEKGVNALDNERGRLLRRYDQLRAEITTYENNLGFLNAASKKGNSLVEEMNRKVEKLKEDLKLVKEKIKAIDAENK